MSPTHHAEKLLGEKEYILDLWMSAVRADSRIKREGDLNDSGLRDHVPMVIEEITEFIRKQTVPQAGDIDEARVNVYTRYCQGYRGAELVSELSILRKLLIDSITEGVSATSTTVQSIHVINTYLDEELRYAMALYSEAKRKVS